MLELQFDRDSKGDERPFPLKLSPEAKEEWIAFYNAWAHEQAASEGEIAAAYSKLEAYAARFLLLHHVVSYVYRGEDDRREIGPESVAAGVALCRWFAGEVRRIYAVLGESDEERDTRRLTEFIRSHGGRITVRELQRSNSRKYPDVAAAESTLNTLVESGLAVWKDAERPPAADTAGALWSCVRRMTLPTLDWMRPTPTKGNRPTLAPTLGNEPCGFPGENERVSEVSCVGQEKGETTGNTPAEQVSDTSESECRTDSEWEEGEL